MTEFIEFDLGQGGIDHFARELPDFTGLARDAYSRLSWSEGRAVTLLPHDSSLERALDFPTGGAGVGHADRDWLLAHCRKRMKQYPLCSIVSQDVWGCSPTGAWVEKSNAPMFFKGEDVYYYLNCRDMDNAKLSHVLHACTGQFGVGFLLKCGIAPSIQKQFISDETYNGLLDNIVDVLIKVYDAESYLLWMSKPYPDQG